VFVLSALTMLGVALLSYAPGENFSMGAGEGMLLLGAFLFAGHMVYLGYAVRKGDPGSITFWQLLSAGLVGVFFLVVQRPALTLEMVQKGSLSVLYIGIMATGLCYYLQAKAQKHVSPSQTGIVLSLEGVFGALFSILAGMEALKVSVLLGGALITLSVILMEIKPRRA
jgi:drug/metabolite transporter (DMT)-like permease